MRNAECGMAQSDAWLWLFRIIVPVSRLSQLNDDLVEAQRIGIHAIVCCTEHTKAIHVCRTIKQEVADVGWCDERIVFQV